MTSRSYLVGLAAVIAILISMLLPAFKDDTGIAVKVIAKGTGAALRDGMDGNVDIIFVHAKAREDKFVAEGYGTTRYAVMHNDFVVIGPKNDPAGVAEAADVYAGLQSIASAKAEFISRGDDSGTHTKEQFLWLRSGVEVVAVPSVGPAYGVWSMSRSKLASTWLK